MDDNFSWKIVYIAAVFSLAVLAFAYYLISPRDSTFFSEENNDKIAEFKNTRIEGRKEGKKAWEFYAGSGWTNKNQEITSLVDVSRGTIYKEGKPILAGLSAPLLKVYRRAETIEIFGQPEGKSGPSRLKAYIDLNKIPARPNKKSDWTQLRSDRIKYYVLPKKSQISGNISLLKDTERITTATMEIDHEQKSVIFPGKITIQRKDGKIEADSAAYSTDNEQLNLAGNVSLAFREKKILTSIKCNQATLARDPDRDVNLSGSLEVVQGKKFSIAQSGVYSKKQKSLHLSGGAKTVLEKAANLFQKETANHLQNPDARRMLKEKTVIQSNEIVFSTKTGDAKAAGSVEVTQKGREARSEAAGYDDKKELLTLTGNVFMKKGEDWIAARQVVISVKKETFEASGVTESKFKL